VSLGPWTPRTTRAINQLAERLAASGKRGPADPREMSAAQLRAKLDAVFWAGQRDALECCEHGHYDCAVSYGGYCFDEMSAAYFGKTGKRYD